MSTTTLPQAADQNTPVTGGLLVYLPPLHTDGLYAALDTLRAAMQGLPAVIAYPDLPGLAPLGYEGVRLQPFAPAAAITRSWIISAADYLNAYKLMQEHGCRGALLLTGEFESLSPAAMRELASAVVDGGTDLAVPRYTHSPYEGLVNVAVLAPVSRALFSTRVHFPQAIDLAISARMAERLATVAQRFTAANQNDALLWPVSEAAVSGFSIAEIDVGARTFPLPDIADLTQILTLVAGSLFSDVEAKATYWQRARQQNTVQGRGSVRFSEAASRPDVADMIQTFRLGYRNLSEIWSLVLPPNSLLGLKKLSLLPEESFSMPDSLWVRIVYDFLLAWRLRTINRTHLLGALTPLYLAWVATYLLDDKREQHLEALAAAFESDKPYLVSRWRWPDRFNP